MKRAKTKIRDFEAYALPQLENLYRTAVYVLDDESNARDMVQESFISAWHSWNDVQYGRNCRLGLFSTMAGIFLSKYRPSAGLSGAIDGVGEIDGYLLHSRWLNQRHVADSGQNPFSALSESDIKKAIRGLPGDFGLLVVLNLLEGFTYREIAAITGLNIGIVRSRLHHGRKLLQRELFAPTGADNGPAHDVSRGEAHAAVQGAFQTADRTGNGESGP